jgi:hypothetical protein
VFPENREGRADGDRRRLRVGSYETVDCGDSKEDPLTPIVRAHQHHINSTMLQLIMVTITIVIIIKIITKKEEIQKALTSTGEKK